MLENWELLSLELEVTFLRDLISRRNRGEFTKHIHKF